MRVRIPLLSLGFGLSLGLAVFGLALGTSSFRLGPFSLSLKTQDYLLLSGALLIIGAASKFRSISLPSHIAASVLVILYWCSDLTGRLHTFPENNLSLVTVLCVSLAGCLLWSLFRTWYLAAIVAGCVISASLSFVLTSNGQLIFSDDHPAFLYRLIQLKENFSNVPFYNPMWNAGVEAREFFASGVLNFFLLFSPVLYLSDPTRVYNGLVIALLFVVPVGTSLLAARVLKLDWAEGLVLAIFTLTPSLHWFQWAFSYGTMGFILSTSLIPLNLALLSRYLTKTGEISLPTALLTAASITH